MLTNLIKKIYNLFKKKREEDNGFIIEEPRDVSVALEIRDVTNKVNNIDYSIVGDVNITGNNNNKVFFILDDIEDVSVLFDITFENIKSIYNYNVYDNYKVVESVGRDCGIRGLKFINDNSVDNAILDLTIGELIVIDGKSYEIDGIDIYKIIKQHNKDAKVLFMTAHDMQATSPVTEHYKEKFYNLTGNDISKIAISKNSPNREQRIYNFLKDS